MDGEAEKVNKEGQDDETNDASSDVGGEGGDWHLGVAKLVPEIFNGVKTNQSSDEESHQLDTGNETNAKTSHEQPKEPLGLEAVLALAMELGPAECRGNGTEQEHRIEEDKPGDGGV